MVWAALGVLSACLGCGSEVAAEEPPIADERAEIRLERPGPRPAPPEMTDPAPASDAPLSVHVDCGDQRLELRRGDRVLATYVVSTSRYGLGSAAGSNRTPLGRHRVAATFGADAPLGAVFRARRATGEVATIHTDSTDVEEDLVLTRVLWLEGLEPGRNRGRGVDSHSRCIYIHGTNEEGLLGTPASHGCVRMANRDVVALFEQVPVGTEVWIHE